MKEQSVDYIVTKIVKRVWKEGSEVDIRIQKRVDRNLTTQEISIKKRTYSIKEAIEAVRKKYNVDTENIENISILVIYNRAELAFIRWDSKLKKHNVVIYDNMEVIGKEIGIEELIGKEILDNTNTLVWMLLVSKNSKYELRTNDMKNSSIKGIEVRLVDCTDSMDIEESENITEIKNLEIDIDISGCIGISAVELYKSSEYIHIKRVKVKGELRNSKEYIKIDFGGRIVDSDKIDEIYIEDIDEALIYADNKIGKLSIKRCGIGRIASISKINRTGCNIDVIYLDKARSTKHTVFNIGDNLVIADRESEKTLTENGFKASKVIETSKDEINRYIDRAKKLNIDLRGTLLIKTED